MTTFVLAAILGVAAAALVACGGDRRELIPQRSADRLKNALGDVRSAVDDGDCEAAAQALSSARRTLGNLPAAVDDRLVARLREGISQLEELAPQECEQQETQTTTVETTETTTPPETTATETTTTETETTPTDTTPTETAPTETTPAEPTPTETSPAPEGPAVPPADPTGGAQTP